MSSPFSEIRCSHYAIGRWLWGPNTGAPHFPAEQLSLCSIMHATLWSFSFGKEGAIIKTTTSTCRSGWSHTVQLWNSVVCSTKYVRAVQMRMSTGCFTYKILWWVSGDWELVRFRCCRSVYSIKWELCQGFRTAAGAAAERLCLSALGTRGGAVTRAAHLIRVSAALCPTQTYI